ncbi:MAG: VOC family protein [Desulfobulbaceae bacterium]|jgi:PhnB protein|nr:VOC family protein [Desulfobulbaceae bacterium]MDY0351738.1 VOC family protein [Desulfobulbaceae bacterium]
MLVEPYLFFEGRCEEALEFYRRALGAEVTFLMRYRESPDPASIRPGMEEKVMHANVRIGNSTLMVSDGLCSGRASFSGFSLTIALAEEAETRRLFGALSEGGKVEMPLAETFWSPCFGMVTDRFGVSWMVMTEAPE